MKRVLVIAILMMMIATSGDVFSQDSLITRMAKENLTTFVSDRDSFRGLGWNKLLGQIKQSDFVLVGEDHFTVEIPLFISAVSRNVKFDNFFAEIDPYSAAIIESKINNLSGSDLEDYLAELSGTFSFYSLQTEFDMIRQLMGSKTRIKGTDQILLVADRLICNELKKKTKNKRAKKIYEVIENKSKEHFEEFLKDLSKPFYLLTADFEKNLETLSRLRLSKEEQEQIEALRLSARINKEQNHSLRIQLMKNLLMKDYREWIDKKNLFKFGSNHLSKGESMMTIYDIGNLVSNIADSQYKQSLHIMMVGRSGMQASPFKGFPPQKVDENSNNRKALKPFFNAVKGEQWHCIDMLPLRKALESGKLVINDIKLARIIKGYDVLVVIPTVTAAPFIADL